MTFKPTPWSASLEHGIIWQDSQHRGLVELNEKLFYAFMEGKTEHKLTDAINTLREYTHIHFDLEHEYMTAYGYPSSAEHLEEHKKFADDLARFADETEAMGGVADDLSIPTLCMEVERWIVHHIKEVDCELARFIREVEIRRWREESAG